jgi:hypothetical protein
MSAGISSKRQNFDNLSYISDGRDRISYINDPYAISSHDAPRDGHGIVLRPTELNKARRENNTSYTFRPGQENIYAYNNAAFRYLIIENFLLIYLLLFKVISAVSIHVDLQFDHNIQIYTLCRTHLKNPNIIEKVNRSFFFLHINNAMNYK